jgi:Tfp pilus assembly protein PilN
MKDINLLPPEYFSSNKIIGFANHLKKYIVIGYVLLVISAAALTGTLYYLSNESKNLGSNKIALQQELKNLEKTEAKIVLLKDRVGKAEQILSSNSTSSSIDTLKTLNEKVPSGITLGKVSLAGKNATIEVGTVDSTSMANFINFLLTSGLYHNVTLRSFGYMENTGYSLSFSMDLL